MTADHRRLVRRLRKLALGKTQAEAARIVGLTASRVGQIARAERLRFRPARHLTRARRPASRACRRCRLPRNGSARCLRCKWTPARIRALRKRLGLSQVDMAVYALGMNVWAVQRWERRKGAIRPSAAALARLEALEGDPTQAPRRAPSRR